MSLTIKATSAQVKEMTEYYEGYLVENNNQNIIARVRLENVAITFYTTNTVLFQGANEAHEHNVWAKRFGLELATCAVSDYEAYESVTAIGCDEVGSGDYFGPIVVCSALVTSDQIEKLRQLGVKDSKLLTDDAIIDIALRIKNLITHTILVLPPERFNALHKTENDNMNFIKACLHNNAINSILKKVQNVKYDAIIVDEFTPREKYFHYLRKLPNVCQEVVLIPKAERVHISVAAASILARATFLKEMKNLSNTYKIQLLKGASAAVDRQAVGLVKSHGTYILKLIAKYKFVNTQRIFEYAEKNGIKFTENRDLNDDDK